jgi:large subunit ribosomal protein L3
VCGSAKSPERGCASRRTTPFAVTPLPCCAPSHTRPHATARTHTHARPTQTTHAEAYAASGCLVAPRSCARSLQCGADRDHPRLDTDEQASRCYRHEMWHDTGVLALPWPCALHPTLPLHPIFAALDSLVPVTIVELQDLQVCKVRTRMSDGLCALQLGGGWQKRKRMSLAEARQYETRGLAYKQYVREFPVTEDALLPVGTTITARHFVPGQFVDVQAVTRGKGFAGAMKRWGFRGQPASHGASLSHRSVGSMGGAAGSMYATRVWKGKKMPGRMGGRRRTVSGLMVWKVLPKYNLLYLRGSVPGSKGCEVRMRDSLLPKQTFATPPPFPTFLPGDDGDDDMEELLAPLALEVPAVASGKKK